MSSTTALARSRRLSVRGRMLQRSWEGSRGFKASLGRKSWSGFGYDLWRKGHRRRVYIAKRVVPRRARLLGSGTLDVDATGPVACPSNSLKFSSNVEKATVPGPESDVKEKPDKVPSAGTS